MSDDLVARLLNAAEDAEIETSKVIRDYPSALREAADRIATLSARVAELEAERDKDHQNINLKAGVIERMINQQAEDFDRAEAALATARDDALEEKARAERAEATLATTEMNCRSYQAMAADAIHRMDNAQAALAAMKGGAA